MELTIFGATGGTGTCLTRQALTAGHHVTAVVRDPARLPVPASPRLRVMTADLMDPAAISPAVTGADAVLAAFGPRGTGPTTVLREGTRSVIRRWQAARGYPTSGFLNKLQHKALLAEIVATTQTSSSDDSEDDHPRRHHSGGGGGGGGGGGRHYRGGGGGPGGLIGGMMGGLFR